MFQILVKFPKFPKFYGNEVNFDNVVLIVNNNNKYVME